MALTHNITSIRPYLTKYRLDILITDTDTGLVYDRTIMHPSNPSTGEQATIVVKVKNAVQKELDYDANGMNLPSDVESLLEYYQNIKQDIVARIRAFSAVTQAQAADYISNTYPNSPFDFSRLYTIWSDMAGVSTWEEFKTFVIDHKFREVD